jgi:class 3 adenylate cyclase/tetratricopeptide (TPR) repeat protein
MLTCPSCGQENPDGFRFCGACGAALTVEQPERREERKIVTVLFCDLVGSTAHADMRDPEDVRALLSLYHTRVRTELERFGGTVEKFIGDAVVAVFGAPAAHEDDPERAVRAALAIRGWAMEEDGPKLRIAVNTGEALVTLGARPEEGEGMVAGDVVNTAARLQSAAPTNGILVGETTYRATRERIAYREPAMVEARGKAEKIRVWEALGARSPEEEERQPQTRLVGREREVRLLVELFERVREERSPQLVTLLGPPGIGKSRLVHELHQHVLAERDLVIWREGRSLPYGEGGGFWGLAEIVKTQLGVRETDSVADIAEALRLAVSDLLSDDPRVASHLGGLLGIAGGESLQADREDAFAAWRRFLESVAEHAPLVLVFDDLQWADDGLLDFVDYLVEWASGVPILVVATARPELLERRPGWAGGKLNASALALSPLKEADCARLISALLERTLISVGMQATLLDLIGGNPLYAEQYALLYRERGSAELSLPEGIQGIIAARLDLLPAAEKAVLQDAAVVGKVFWPGALRGDIAEITRTLHALERKDFVRRQRTSSVEDEDEYAFCHLLVRDVAYGQIPRAARANRHRLTAVWLEALSRNRSDHAELLADHYERALELTRAVGDVRPDDEQNARHALRRAADHALRLAAFEEAASLYERALALSPSGDERPRLLLAYGKALQLLVDERGQSVLSEAGELFAARGEVEAVGEAEACLAELVWRRGDGPRAAEHARHAVELLRESPASSAKASALSSLARIETFTGDLEKAIGPAEEAVAIAAEIGSDEILAHALNSLGTAKVNNGDASGLADLERSLELALATKSPEVFGAYNNLGGSLVHQFGEVARGRQLFADAGRLAEQVGRPHWIGFFRDAENDFLFADGDWDAILATEDSRFHVFIQFARGELDAARRTSAERLASARRGGRTDDLAEALALSALVLRRLRDPEGSAVIDELVSRLPASAMWITVAPLIGIALADEGKGDMLLAATESVPASPKLRAVRLYAEREFVEAANAFAELDEHVFESLARLRGGERLAAEGSRAEADRELGKAHAFFRKARATMLIDEAERLVAATG